MEYPQYRPQQADRLPLTDAELEALDGLLMELPTNAAMNIEGLDGYLTALLLSPQAIEELPGAAWLPAIWGGDGTEDPAPFKSGKQKKRVVLLTLRHLHSSWLARRAPQDTAPTTARRRRSCRTIARCSPCP